MKIVISLILVLFISAGHVQPSPLVNRIVALVNGETITLLELQDRVRHFLGLFQDINIDDLSQAQLEQTQKQVLEQMVNDILLKQEAARFGIEVTDREIRNHINRLSAENNMSPEEFESHLKNQGLTLEAYKKQTRDTILRQRVLNLMVRRKVVVTLDEIETYYKDNISQFQEDKKVHLKVILVPELEQAIDLRDRITSGDKSFDQAAELFSQGPNPSQGGDLGFIEWKRLAPEWREALNDLEKGSLSQPFQVRGGGALIMLMDKTSGGDVPLSQVEDRIREELFDSKLDGRFEDYISGLRQRAVIDIRL